MSLAKHPASTVQILGAEKALFRALKTKHETPKYGLIYHASLIGQAPPKYKGKVLAAGYIYIPHLSIYLSIYSILSNLYLSIYIYISLSNIYTYSSILLHWYMLLHLI